MSRLGAVWSNVASELEVKDWIRSSTEKMQRETDLAAVKKSRRRDRLSKARKSRANVRLDENVLTARENATRKAVAEKSRQEGSVVVIEDSVAMVSETAPGATPANVRFVHVMGDVGIQRLTWGAGAHRGEENEVPVLRPA